MSFPRYKKYKDSGVEWLGEVPEHWDATRLSSISTKITNGYVGPTRDILVDEGIKYLQSLHIKGNRIVFDVPYFVKEEWSNQHQKSILESGDVLIVQTGGIGQVAVVTDEFSGCNCHALIIVAPMRANVNGEWIAWVLNSDYGFHRLLSLQTGALHPHLNCGNIKDIFIPLPPIEEQQNIAAFLNQETTKIDALVAEQQRLIELLKEKRQAVISHAVTKGLNPDAPMKDSGIEWLGEVPEHWKISALKHKIKMRYGDALASEIREEGTIEVFGSNGCVGLHCIANTKAPAIVLGRKGSYGKIVWAKNGGFVIDTAYSIDADTTDMNLRWVYYALQPLGLDSLSQDTGVPGLGREKAYEIRIATPPSEEQQTIANFLDHETAKIDELIAEAQRAIELLKERRTALISVAVTGKIDVRGLVADKLAVE